MADVIGEKGKEPLAGSYEGADSPSGKTPMGIPEAGGDSSQPIATPHVVDVPSTGASGPVGEFPAPKEAAADEQHEREERLRQLRKAERSIESAFGTGRADRSKITRSAQLDAAEAVAMVGIAMESDEAVDEAARISVIAQKSGDAERLRRARKREREARKKATADHRAATRSARRAYDAIKFSSPNRMGVMRAVMVTLALHIVLVLLSLIMTSRDTVIYNSVNIFSWVMVVLEGVAFWLFANRLKMARPFIIGVSIFALVADVIFEAVTHTVGGFTMTVDFMYCTFLILYFTFSKRVQMVLMNDFATFYDSDDDFEINRAGWPFIRNLLVYFIVFSVLGHWMEAAMCQLIRLGLVAGKYDPTNTMLWRDWFYPFPMEGAAVVIIAVALYPLFEWLRSRFRPQGRVWVAYVVSFLANALTCSIIEFTMGIIINADHSLWDYSDMFGNIMGQVCLQNAVAFGAAASIITWFVYPQMERAIARVPVDIMNIVSVVIFGIGGILWSLYLIDPPESHSVITEDEQLAVYEKERAMIEVDIESLRLLVGALERDVRSSTNFDVENAQAEIDNMYKLIDVIERDLGVESDADADDAAAAVGSQDAAPAEASGEGATQTAQEGQEVAAQPAPTPEPLTVDLPQGQGSEEVAPTPDQAVPDQSVPDQSVPDQTVPEPVVQGVPVGEESQGQQYHIAA